MSEPVQDDGGGRLSISAAGVSLELVDVPAALTAHARVLLATVADVVRSTPAVLQRPVLAIRLPVCVVVVRWENQDRGARGPLGWFSAAPPPVVRVCAPDSEPGGLPYAALESVALDEALRAIERADARGLAMLRESARRFPGEPSEARHRFGTAYNLGNSLTHLHLALHEPRAGDAARHFGLALERNDVLSIVELGESLRKFAEMSFQHVAELARFIVYQTLVRDENPPRENGYRSPIWHLDPATGRVARSRAPWPPAFLDLYFRGEPARVLTSTFAIEAITTAVQRQRRAPTALAGRVLPIIRLWREPRDAILEVTPMPFVAPARLLSVLLAAIGVGVAAGMSEDEIRAWLGATDDDVRAAGALEKLTGLETALGVGGGLGSSST